MREPGSNDAMSMTTSHADRFETSIARGMTLAGQGPRAVWSRLPIRAQLIIAIATVCLIAGLIASVLAVYRAQDRARVEVLATTKIAERLIKETVRGLPADATSDQVQGYVSQQLRYFRHVRTSFSDADGHTSLVLPPVLAGAGDEAPDRAPAWFERLVYGAPESRIVPVMLGDRSIGSFTVTGEPADEIAEVWDDLSEVSLVALIVVSLMFAMLYWVLGRVLNPLHTLGSGLKELEAGHYATRVQPPRVKELEPIADRFNALAGALDAAHAENRELLGHLITVQEDERRQIATELHDEAGPCLFGITANAGSVLTMVKGADQDLKDKVAERVAAILDSAERLKSLNRSRLKMLRPIAIGRVSLEELLSDLVGEFEKRYPGANFFLAIEPIAPRYGEAIELTIYRCLQQGLTNALQHGKAENIDARLMLRGSLPGGAAGTHELVLTMTDDGIGVPERTPVGFGLTTMRERVIAVDGTCTISRAKPRGTTITITVPVPATGDPPPHRVLSNESQT
jgi:two-component system sensor histidine kinase UhpB